MAERVRARGCARCGSICVCLTDGEFTDLAPEIVRI